MKLLLGLLLTVCLPTLADAACSGSSPTRTAASASRTEVALCVTAAISGDTINVPAGSATWTSELDISTKNLTIIGAGSGSNPASNTVITGTASNCFAIGTRSGVSSASRISAFRFIDCMVNLDGLNTGNAFRVDNNFVQSTNDREMVISGDAYNLPPKGLFDHNTFQLTRFVVYGTIYGLDEANWQHQIWAQNPDFGGPQAVYIEDSVITANHPGTIDGNYGGRFVMRFNTATTDATYHHEVHGVQGLNRAVQRWEFYGNQMNVTGGPIFTTSYIRGGSGFEWGERISTNGFGDIAELKVERVTEVKDPFGNCDGSWIIDGNVASGYPCRDQIGRTQDSTLYTGNYNGTSGSGAWPTQSLYPAYFWNNKDGSTELLAVRNNGTATHNAENRDFYNFSSATGSPQTVGVRIGTLAQMPANCTAGVGYWATDQGSWNQSTSNPEGVQQNGADGVLYKCVSTNNWQILYTPYTYPHPMQSSTSTTSSLRIEGGGTYRGGVQFK